MISTDSLNLAYSIVQELKTASPYRHGGLRNSISAISIDSNEIKIIVAVDYASYVNNKETLGTHGKHNKNYHWVEKNLDRVCRAYTENKVDDRSLISGLSYEVLEGAGGI